MDNQQGPSVDHRELTQCHVAGWMGGEFGGAWIHVYVCMAESLPCSPETMATLLISYAPIQNNKGFKK